MDPLYHIAPSPNILRVGQNGQHSIIAGRNRKTIAGSGDDVIYGVK